MDLNQFTTSPSHAAALDQLCVPLRWAAVGCIGIKQNISAANEARAVVGVVFVLSRTPNQA